MTDVNQMRCAASKIVARIIEAADVPIEDRATQLDLLRMHVESAHTQVTGKARSRWTGETAVALLTVLERLIKAKHLLLSKDALSEDWTAAIYAACELMPVTVDRISDTEYRVSHRHNANVKIEVNYEMGDR